MLLTILLKSSYSDLRFTAVGSTEGQTLPVDSFTIWDSFLTFVTVVVDVDKINDISE